MKANEAPEKIYFTSTENGLHYYTEGTPFERECIEYIRADTFIEKARKWFETQNEGVDSDGHYKCDMTDFEDFRKYMNK